MKSRISCVHCYGNWDGTWTVAFGRGYKEPRRYQPFATSQLRAVDCIDKLLDKRLGHLTPARVLPGWHFWREEC